MDMKYWITCWISFFAVTPAALGTWSEWSQWSPCSRACAGGLSTRNRTCTAAQSTCDGKHVQHKICNIKACGDSLSWRHEQCSQHNDEPHLGQLYTWLPAPHTRMRSTCTLTCQASGSDVTAVLAARVQDGTRCHVSSKAVCVQGTCQRVGCENIVGSRTRRDECGVCGGTGETCRTEIDSSPNTLKALDQSMIVTEPTHLRSIQNKDLQISRDNSEEQHINHGQNPAQQYFNHATRTESRTYSRDMESHGVEPRDMESRGGVQASLDYQNDNELAELFGISNLPAHLWQETGFGACSVTCGTGVQRASIVCRSTRNGQIESEALCTTRRPIPRERVCDTGVTCTASPARWETGEWSTCSASCGGGIAERPVRCVRYHDSGAVQEADDTRDCEGSIPESRQRCNQMECPQWKAGQWSPCSVTCGAGDQYRKVVCKRVTDDVTCDDVTRPGEKQACHTGVLCLPDLSVRRIPEQQNRIVIDNNKPVNFRPVNADRLGNSITYDDNYYGEFRDNPNLEWGEYRAGYGNYRDGNEDFLDFDYRDYTNSDVEYNGNSLMEELGIGRDFEYRGDEMMASSNDRTDQVLDPGSGEAPREQDTSSTWLTQPGKPSFWASWGECSVTCGYGVRRRYVECRVFNALSNTYQKLPESRCTSTGAQKPLDRDECRMPNCPLVIASQGRVRYGWQTDGYGACSATCGGGMRERVLSCIRIDTTRHVQVEESFCEGLSHPSGMLKQSCNDFSCPATWKIYAYGECSHRCGGGTAQRQVDCVVEERGQMMRVPDTQCLDIGLEPEARTKLCNQVPCPPEWVEGQWSQCSATCGRGMRQRQVLCKRVIPPSREIEIMHDQYCSATTKPESLIPCNAERECFNREFSISPDPSFYVQLQPRSDLRVVAGGTAMVIPGTVVKVRCPVSRGFPKTSIEWRKEGESVGRKGHVRKSKRGVLLIRGMEWTDAGVYTCHAESKSTAITLMVHSQNEAYNKAIARGQVGARDQNFLRRFRQQRDQDGRPKEEITEPYIFTNFESTELPFRFVESDWGACSISCGGAGLQSRHVTCELNLDQYLLQVHDDYCFDIGLNKPLSTKDCGFDRCPEWEEGQFGQCSDLHCVGSGEGSRVRPLYCVAPDGSYMDERMCDQQNRPRDKLPCPKSTCVAHWVESGWTECSRTCGGVGYQTRSLLCVWAPNQRPAIGACEALVKPDVIKQCATDPCPSRRECRDESTFCNLVELMKLCRYPDYVAQCCKTCTQLRTRYRYKL